MCGSGRNRHAGYDQNQQGINAYAHIAHSPRAGQTMSVQPMVTLIAGRLLPKGSLADVAQRPMRGPNGAQQLAAQS